MKKIKEVMTLQDLKEHRRNPEKFKGEELEYITTCLESNVLVPIGKNCDNPECGNCRNYEEIYYDN